MLRDARPAEPHSPSGRPAVSPSAEKAHSRSHHLRSVWPRIVADARTKSPMLGKPPGGGDVTEVERTVVMLRPARAVTRGVERQTILLGQVIGRYVTESVRVQVVAAAAGAPGAGRATVRLTEEGANAERLERLRGKDPTLNAAVDALDFGATS